MATKPEPPVYKTYDGQRFKLETTYKRRVSATSAKHYMKEDHPTWKIRIAKFVFPRAKGGVVYGMYIRKQ